MMAGRLRNWITIQRPKHTQDSFGESDISYEDDFSCWAEIWDMSGREGVVSGRVEAKVTHQVRIRYCLMSDDEPISPTCRLRLTEDYGDRYLTIQTVNDPDNRHRELRLMCVSESS